jgi:DNA-binding transcriptional LysR family regulator
MAIIRDRAVNIRQLETFLAIVQCGSFAGAADRLNATTSTISARIQELEESLGVTLFDRSQRKVRLTPKGRELCRYAERATSAFSDIRMFVGNGEALSGLFRLGVAEMVAVTWLPKLVDLIHGKFPKLALELNVSLTARLLQRLGNDELDLVLAPGLKYDADLTAKSIGRVHFVWMAGRKQQLPKHTIEPGDLRQIRILSLGKDSFHHHTVQRWLSSRDDGLPNVDLCDSMDVIASLTKEGLGISLLPVNRYKTEIDAGDLRVMKTLPAGPMVEFFAVYRSSLSTAIPAKIADLAKEASTFEMMPADGDTGTD